MSTESVFPVSPAARIIVGVDGSASSIGALREANRLATALNTELVAITTWQYPSGSWGFYDTEWSPQPKAEQALRDAVDQAFDSTASERLRTEVVEGHAARTLIKASEDALMLVVGSRGHGGFSGLLLGSVSSACAEHARCPVLVYHPRHTGTKTPDTPDIERE